MVENFWGEKEMKVGKYKLVLFKFMPYEYRALEKYLENMALKGWILNGMFGYFLRFVKEKPQKLKYTVDVVNNISIYAGNDSNASMEYREYCEAAGWKFVCERDKILIFSKNEEIDLPIQTDEREKFKSIFKASLSYILLDTFAAFIWLFTQCNMWFGGYSANFLADNIILIVLLSIFIWALQGVTQLIHFLIWSMRAKRKLDIEDKINYEFKIITDIKLMFNKLIIILVFMGIIIGALLLGGLFTVTILIIIISIWLGSTLRNYISKSNYSSKIRISYDLYKSKYKMIIDYALTFELEKKLEFYGEIIELNTDLPSNIKVYRVVNQNTFIIASKNKFIRAYVESDIFSNDDILNIIYNKVFS